MKKIKKDKERKPINEKKKKNTIAKIKYFKENKIDANFIRKNQQRFSTKEYSCFTEYLCKYRENFNNKTIKK